MPAPEFFGVQFVIIRRGRESAGTLIRVVDTQFLPKAKLCEVFIKNIQALLWIGIPKVVDDVPVFTHVVGVAGVRDGVYHTVEVPTVVVLLLGGAAWAFFTWRREQRVERASLTGQALRRT